MIRARARGAQTSCVVSFAALLATGCLGLPEIPEGEGQGLRLTDGQEVPPAGVPVAERPEITVGDRWEYVRGGVLPLAYRVVEENEDGFLFLEEETGLCLQLDRDLAQLGEAVPEVPELMRVLAPRDVQVAWPLWPGKTWSCHYLLKAPGQAVPIIVGYLCDTVEELDLAVGRVQCWRIWRKARPAVEGAIPEQVSVWWWSPRLKTFVRRLDDGTLTELVHVGPPRPAAEDPVEPADGDGASAPSR